MSKRLLPPFPYFGGKRKVVDLVWSRLGEPKQYIEPFCGSAVMLLGAPRPASLEVVNDINGFIANFWRCVKHQPQEVAHWADYPVSHIDMGARHGWLMGQRDRLGVELQDPDWPGDAKVAGWWLWGQCSWIGSGWCDWFGQVPHVSDAGRGVQAVGQVPHVSDAGRGVQAVGQVPHVGNAGMGVFHTSGGEAAFVWLTKLTSRLGRVRVTHGSWERCLNHHYGKERTAVFLDPPYLGTEGVYGSVDTVSAQVGRWAAEHPDLRVALCGHDGEHDLPGWECIPWKRAGKTYNGGKTTAMERIWFSPGCVRVGDGTRSHSGVSNLETAEPVVAESVTTARRAQQTQMELSL